MVGVLAVAKFIGGTTGRIAAITEISKEAAEQGVPTEFFKVKWGASKEDVKRIRPNVIQQSAGFLAEDIQFYGRQAKISYFFSDNILSMYVFGFVDVLGSNETFLHTQDKLISDYGAMSNPSVNDGCLIYSEREAGRFKITHCVRMFGDKPFEQVTFYRTNGNPSSAVKPQSAPVSSGYTNNNISSHTATQPASQLIPGTTEPAIEKEIVVDNRDAESLRIAGVNYQIGKGVTANTSMAIELYQKSAAKGNSLAMWNLGSVYDRYQFGPDHVAKALYWYQKAAALGNSNAERDLGVAYQRGELVAKDDSIAFKWYLKAASHGDAMSQGYVATAYSQGLSVVKNNVQALKWEKMAAANGDEASQFGLGMRYAEGDGVPMDKVIAYGWLNLAAASPLNNVFSISNKRTQLEQSMTGSEVAEAQRLSSSWKVGQLLTH